MIYKGKYKIIDNFITACDYNFVLSEIKEAIKNKEKLLISPIASHTLVKAHYDKNLKKILDKFDYLVPDSQWVRWSIPFLYGKEKKLKDRVYGPDLMLKTCNLAEKNKYKIFLYGNTYAVLNKLKEKLRNIYPSIQIVEEEASKFRELTENELKKLIKKITYSKSNIIFVSLGSPKQEVFSYKLTNYSKYPFIIIPVGAAFDFLSGNKPQAPKYIRQIGYEWLFRSIIEPKRLISRYSTFIIKYMYLIIRQKIEQNNKFKFSVKT